MKKKRKKLPTISKLKRILDRVFSFWIRKRDRNICFTCSKPGNQAGHYISRRHHSVRWDERNVHVQCAGCNLFKKGALDEYALRLQEKYGEGILKELNTLKRSVKQWRREELLQLIQKYS